MVTHVTTPMAVAPRAAAYERGRVLTSAEDEARKSTQGRRLIQQRVRSLGPESIYNLTGLVRTFPLHQEDLDHLDDQFAFYTHFLGQAEELAIQLMGANPREHAAVMTNRVSAAVLAVMVGTLRRGDRVLSVVAQGRSHPSVQQAVELVGASFYEVQGLEALTQALRQGPCQLLAITPLTPSMYHLPAADVRETIALAKAVGAVVFIDDAHMMARSVFYDEPLAFGLGEVDIAVWSLDKHVPGPRGAAIVGRRSLIPMIAAQAFQFGLEAQSGHYVAMLRGMRAFDPAPIRRAGALGRELFRRLHATFGPRVYLGGPGVSFAAEDFATVVCERAGCAEALLAPSEISIVACFLLLQQYGVITIPITGYPGAAATLRLMMHPDGGRFGLEDLETAVDATIDRTAAFLQKPEAARELLLGEA